jgi:hypothetical protein
MVRIAFCGPPVPAITVSAITLVLSPSDGDFVLDQRLDVLVVDMLLAVGQRLEAAERILQGVVAQLVAQFFQLVLEGMAAGVLAHDQRRRLHAPSDSGRMIS